MIGAVHVGDALHIERIRHGEAGEAELAAQQVGEDRPGYGGAVLRIERGVAHVRGHRAARAGRERRAKRYEFPVLQRRAVDVRLGTHEMRVLRGVAMTWEMLGRRRDGNAFAPADPCRRECRDARGIVAERTGADDRIAWI